MSSGAHSDEWLDQNVRSSASPKFKALEITTGPVTIAGSEISATEMGYLDGLTIGTVTASKAVVVDANKDIGDFRNLDAVNIDAGASGTAGTVDVYPTTASRGKIIIAAQDHASADRTTTIQNATDGSASATITLPNATCTLPGIGLGNTFTAAQTIAVDDASAAAVTDLLTLKHTVNIASASGIGAGVSVIVENDTDATTEVASLDWQATTVTKGTMDVDIIAKTMLGGTVATAFTVDASAQELQVGANSTDTDGLNAVRIYPVTASRGSLVLSAAAHASADRSTTITNATDGSASATITLPNATCTLPGIGLANTFTAAQTVAIDDAVNDNITDVLTLKHSTTGSPTNNLGAGVSVIVENATDATTEVASLDFQATEVTKATMDVDVVLKTMLGGAVSQVFTVDASDQSVQIGANSTDADGIYQLKLYPVTASKGALVLQAVANTGDTNVIITNAAHGQQSTLTIPDPGAAAANFLLSAGAQTIAGAQTLSAGAANAVAALRFGDTATEGLEVKVIDETVNLTNAVETNLTETIPSGAVILSVQGNAQTTVVGDGTGDDGLVKWGLGTTADPDKYGKSADLVQNHKVDTIPAWTVLSGAEQICVKGCDAGGAAVTEKFVADVPAGTRNQVRVRIVYLTTNSLDDAA